MPKLSSRFKTFSWIASTYYAEGLPYSLVQQVSVQFFTAAGASTPVIGLLSYLNLPWNLKMFWSPLIDLLGDKKRWIWRMELILGAVALLLIWPAEHLNLPLAFKIFALMGFMSATHDMSVDGYYIQTLSEHLQAGYSGLRVAAYRVAMLVGNGALVILAGAVSWAACFATAAGMLWLLALWHRAILPAALPAERTLSRWHTVRLALSSYLTQAHIGWALAFIVLFQAGDALMFAMVAPFLNHLGYGLVARGLLTGTLGTVTVIGGSIVGGLLISRWGLRRMIFPLTLLQSLAIPAYSLLSWTHGNIWWVAVTVAFEQAAAGFGTAVLMVFLMQRCEGKYAAVHFAIGSALMSVASTVLGGFSGFLVRDYGYTMFFLLAFVAAWPGVLLAYFMPSGLFKAPTPILSGGAIENA